MKKKLFAFTLSLTVIAVTVTAINCGCVFAEIPSSQKKVEQAAMAHCEHREEASKEAEECCLGCQLQLGALNAHNIDFQLQRSGELALSKIFFAKQVLQIAEKHSHVLSRLHGLESRGVSIPGFEQPIYIVLKSFLI